MPGVHTTQEDVFTTTISDILNNATEALSNQTDGPGGGHELSPTKAKVKQIFDILIIILICVIMMSVGAVVKLDMLKAHFRRPVGLIIGMVCQFIILPGVTFGLAHALQFERWNAIGMILIGTTPGGSLSNMYTYYIDGDVPLR